MANLNWHGPARTYLERLGFAEYKAQLRQHLKKGRAKSTFRYNPSQYHRNLIECLNQNDERKFKALKLEQGYASTIGS